MTAQSLCSLPAFQNGRPRFGQIFIKKRRFYDVNRFKSSILSCDFSTRPMAIFHVRLPRQTLLLQMSSLWTNIKSTDIHQSIETNSEFSTESGNKDGSISGRFVNHGFIQRRAVKAFKFSDDMLNKTRVYNQRRKIMSETFSSDQLSRISNKLKVNDFETAKTETSRSDMRMQKGKRVEDTPCQKISITNRQDCGNNQHDSSSKALLSFSSKRQKPGFKVERLEQFNKTFKGKSSSVRMVDKGITKLEWKKSNTKLPTNNNLHRRLKF